MSKKVRDVMTKECQWIPPETSAAQAAKKMRDEDIGFLPVGKNDKLVGMLTDRDITIRCTAEGKDPTQTPVETLMTRKTYYCYDDQDVEAVCNNLGEIRVRRLPVVDRDKRLVGIVSMGDLAQAATRANVGQTEQQITAETAQRKAA